MNVSLKLCNNEPSQIFSSVFKTVSTFAICTWIARENFAALCLLEIIGDVRVNDARDIYSPENIFQSKVSVI